MSDKQLEFQGKDLVPPAGGQGEEKWRRRPRKTIGEAGSRKQTLIGLVITIVLGLMFYLPVELKQKWQEWNKEDVITIEKPIGDNRDVSEVLGFKVEIKRQDDMLTAVNKLLEGLTGDYGIYVKQTEGDKELKINEDKVMTAASMIKLAVLAAYYQATDQARLDPNEIYVLDEKDRWVYGTGSMQNQPAGTKYSYQRVAFLAANESDNMGAEVLIKKLKGYKAVQTEINKWGLEKTLLKENETTAEETGKLLMDIFQGLLLSPASRQELLENLTNTVLEDRITAGVPSGVKVRHKFGSEAGVVNDCGIVEAKKAYVICLMSNNIKDGEAQAVLPKISRVVWEWLGK